MLDKKDFGEIENILDKRFEQQTREYQEYLDYRFKIELKPIKTDIARIRRDISTIVDFFDREISLIFKVL